MGFERYKTKAFLELKTKKIPDQLIDGIEYSSSGITNPIPFREKSFFVEETLDESNSDVLEIIVTTGLPFSGKSAWAKQFVAENFGEWVCIDTNVIRDSMFGVFAKKTEKDVHFVRDRLVYEFLLKKKNIIVVDYNYQHHVFNQVYSVATITGRSFHISEKVFFIELEDSLRENAAHGNLLTEKEIRYMHELFLEENILESGTLDLTFRGRPWFYDPSVESSKQKAVICDVEQTIALFNRGGFSFVYKDAPVQNKKYTTNFDLTIPNPAIIDMLRGYYKIGYKVFLLSNCYYGSFESMKSFFDKYLDFPYTVYMRPFDSDSELSDYKAKKMNFEKYIKDKYDISIAIDDNPYCCDMWRSFGIQVVRALPDHF